MRVYHGLYPDDVAGMVLVDPIDVREERMGMASRIPFHLGYPPDLVLRTASNIGLMRLLPRGRRPEPVPKGLTPGERATLSGLEREPKMHAAFLAEQGFSRSLEELRASGSLGNCPLTVLRQEDSVESPSGAGAEAIWAGLSTRVRQIVVPGTGQSVQYEAPDAVVGSVRELVQELRRKP
jgi:pimeloyl-ACP methyl ester carboxylesterase